MITYDDAIVTAEIQSALAEISRKYNLYAYLNNRYLNRGYVVLSSIADGDAPDIDIFYNDVRTLGYYFARLDDAQAYFESHDMGAITNGKTTNNTNVTQNGTTKTNGETSNKGKTKNRYDPVNTATSRLSGVDETAQAGTSTAETTTDNATTQVNMTTSTGEGAVDWGELARRDAGQISPIMAFVNAFGLLLIRENGEGVTV